jgi:hypothetical protein
MPWITESDKRFWMPDILPEPTDEYQQEQSEKFYLTGEGKERRHPGWTYADNTAYVDDEYLFQNEGWKLVVDEVPVEPVTNRTHQVRNTPDQWQEIDERNVKVTYSISGFITTTLPRATQAYQTKQLEKRYLTTDGNELTHPKWTYTKNGAYVDDEYLFQNEGWKLIIDEVPVEPVVNIVHYSRNTPDLWEEIDEKNIKVTYSIFGYIPNVLPEPTEEYQQSQRNKFYFKENGDILGHPGWSYSSNSALVDDEYLLQNGGWRLFIDDGGLEITEDDLKHKTRDPKNLWDKTDPKVVKTTYTITDFTEEEVTQYEEKKWQKLRDKRDVLLGQTDWVIVRSMEKNLVVSNQVTSYRQQLRDLPKIITNIIEFKIDDDTLWPTRPQVYFEV